MVQNMNQFATNKRIINTPNSKINKVLQDMVNNGYESIPSATAMNPVVSYGLGSIHEPFIDETGMTPNMGYDTSKMHNGPAGVGFVAKPSPGEIIIN